MVRFFLKAKHWQLFLLMFAIPFTFQMIFMALMFIDLAQHPSDPMVAFRFFKWFPVFMFLYMGFHFGWFWSVATGLRPKIPVDIRPNIKKFKILMLVPIIYLTIIFCTLSYFFSVFNPESMGNMPPNPALIPIVMLLFIPLHFFSIFCIFYSIYFVAKTFKTAELQKELQFSDFAGEFFLLWFYVVGIWILQPKINQMAIEMEQRNQP